MRLALRGSLLLIVGTTACAELTARSPLEHARRSPEALAEAALEALRDEDEDALVRLMVTRNEYEELIWPSLPDREHVPFDFVWSVTGPRSRKARSLNMSDYGGLPLELVRVDLGDELESYDDFDLHRGARMIVRNTESGREGPIPLMDVLVEMDGGWKFMNFREDL